VSRLLRSAHPGLDVELVVVETAGDQRLDVPVWELGGQGVFVKEVEAAVLDGRADVAVHSAKDLPSLSPPGLVIGAVPLRGDPRDALVGARLADLPPGAIVATGSVRRRAQLAWLRPDLTFVGLRGNIATRLAQRPDGGVVVVAAAALQRLGLLDSPITVDILPPSVLLPQVGQGTMAVECRSDDPSSSALIAAIDDTDTHRALTAERAFLAQLGGGCDLPVGAYATRQADGVLAVEGLLASLDGRILLRQRLVASAGDAALVGDAALAGDAALGCAVAHALLEAGGAALLEGSSGRVAG
jgi:hydroxymethylbilane synthase